MNNKRIIVIGLGSMGKRRIRLLRFINNNLDIIGVDSNEDRIKQVQEMYGIESYKSIDDVDKNNVDIAFVCTSPLSHAVIINKCLKNKWDVFTEINLVDDMYDENIQLAKDNNKVLFLSSTPMYRQEMLEIQECLNENKKPCNYIYHIGQYLPDWHPWEQFKDFFVGDKRTNGCREIMGIELPWMTKAFGNIKSVKVVKNNISELDINYSDSYLIQLEHEGNNYGMLAVDVVCREAVRKLEIYNDDIYISWNGTPDTLKIKNKKEEFKKYDNREYIHEEGYGKFVNESAYINEIRTFFKVLDGEQAIYSFENDKKILEIIDEIEKD